MRTLACAGSMALMFCVAFGQDAARPAFEVASVKPNTSGAIQGGVRSDPERLTATNATVRQLLLFAYNLRYLQQPVLDKTGVDGRFSIQLEWVLDIAQQAGAPGPETSDPGASLFTAVQEQLGLKLEPHRSDVEFLVIDSVQKPSDDE
jgi:hypothetical protein